MQLICANILWFCIERWWHYTNLIIIFECMKSLKPVFIITVLSIFIAMFFLACKPKPGTWVNEKIPAEKQVTFKELNTELLKVLKANDPKTLENIMSKELLETPGKTG